ncbi:MAG: CDP-glycerol glycerophosphotransferase family protein [Lachnospiraceae bacterium]|nr:CDP-glycerol glycerophosphotransferase family protein [Lachnospiraceae bacterium]
MNTLERILIEGRFFKAFWNGLDRRIGILSRKIMCKRTPIDPNKVFFSAQESRYTCNPKYISRELEKRRPDLDIVWRNQGTANDDIPDHVRTVKLNSYEYFHELFSAKVIVANSFLYVGLPFILKKDQVLIETWHGSLGIKRHDKAAMQDKQREYALEQTGKMTTYCISNSKLENGSLSSTYWPNTPMLEYGHARNDLFFDNHKEDRERIKKHIFRAYGIEADTKVVMYAPTFRDSKSFEFYDIDYERLLDTLTARFGGKWCLFLRYHPSMRAMIQKMGGAAISGMKDIYDMTEYTDMQELISVTDIAITDYSSWIYDFVLLRRPGFIFATDLKKYNNERGLYYPLEETPFQIAKNNDELMANIMSFDDKTYPARVEAFLDDKGCIEDGHASERVADLIEKVLKEGR